LFKEISAQIQKNTNDVVRLYGIVVSQGKAIDEVRDLARTTQLTAHNTSNVNVRIDREVSVHHIRLDTLENSVRVLQG
jgi:hypothetical protein